MYRQMQEDIERKRQLADEDKKRHEVTRQQQEQVERAEREQRRLAQLDEQRHADRLRHQRQQEQRQHEQQQVLQKQRVSRCDLLEIYQTIGIGDATSLPRQLVSKEHDSIIPRWWP